MKNNLTENQEYIVSKLIGAIEEIGARPMTNRELYDLMLFKCLDIKSELSKLDDLDQLDPNQLDAMRYDIKAFIDDGALDMTTFESFEKSFDTIQVYEPEYYDGLYTDYLKKIYAETTGQMGHLSHKEIINELREKTGLDWKYDPSFLVFFTDNFELHEVEGKFCLDKVKAQNKFPVLNKADLEIVIERVNLASKQK